METPRLTPPSTREPRPARPEQGFTMVELLVVAVILAIGLLGLIALQVASIKSGGQSRLRGTATLLGHNLLDRAVAEGLVSSAERYDQNGVVSSTGWKYIDPNLSAYTSTATDNLFFDINGNAVPSNDPNLVFTVSWQRFAGVNAGPTYAFQPFVVNVNWKEADASGSLQQVYFSVSRNVRI